MHRRSFILGIGIGIIIGVLLLELFSIGEKSKQQLNAIEQQMNSGDATSSPSPSPSLVEESEELESAPDVSPQAPEAPETDGDVLSDPPPAQPQTPTIEPVETDRVTAPEAATPPKVGYIYRVHPGDTITETAARLAENSIIDNREQFIQYFKNNDVSIRAGFFYIEGPTELEHFRTLFTSKPLTEIEANEQIATKGLTLIQ